jgi:hypothetical protein
MEEMVEVVEGAMEILMPLLRRHLMPNLPSIMLIIFPPKI